MKRGEAVLSAGLPVTPPKADLCAVTFALFQILRKADDPARASAAARSALAMQEASQRKTPGTAKLACTKGCGWCCHSFVGALAPEIFLIASSITADAARRPAEMPRLKKAAAAIAGRTPAERFGAKLPCPLLVDNVCSRYRERPAVCRQTTSLDLAACIEEFDGKGFGDAIPVSTVYIAHSRNARVPLMAALQAAGLRRSGYELSTALVRAIEMPDAEARWLAGEDVFAGLPSAPVDPPAILQGVDLLAAEMAAIA